MDPLVSKTNRRYRVKQFRSTTLMSCCALSEISNILPVYLFSTVTDHQFWDNIESFLIKECTGVLSYEKFFRAGLRYTLLGKMIIMHTKNHNGSSHIGLPEIISVKSPGFLEILESTQYHFLCAPSTPTPSVCQGEGGGRNPPCALTVLLVFYTYVYD